MSTASRDNGSAAPTEMNGTPSLHALLKERMEEAGIRNQTAATVMAPHRDPFRQEKYRQEAEWLSESMGRISVLPIHSRGLHYAALGTTKPDGTPYTNTEKSSEWIGSIAKAARWLGVIPWENIVDEKNDAPTVKRFEPPDPQPVIRVGNVEIVLPDDLAPEANLDDFRPVQPRKLVLFAEKAAVGHVVMPLAERFGVDTYLEAGEPSDTHLHDMAAVGAADGRPMVLFTLSDADPAGYWMPSTIAWKLGALRDGWFPDLEFEVHPIGLLPEQVHAINDADPGNLLPSSPLKEGETRGGAWEETFGIQQVELDAIATLRPDVLRRIVQQGIEPFHDKKLRGRVKEAREAWEAEAQKLLEAQLGPELMAELTEGLEGKLVELRGLADEINSRLWVPTDGIDLPPRPEIPAGELNGTPRCPSRGREWGTASSCRRSRRAAPTRRAGRHEQPDASTNALRQRTGRP